MDEDIIFLRGLEEEEDYESLKPDNEGMGRGQWGSRGEVRCHGPLGAELGDKGQQKEQKGQVLGVGLLPRLCTQDSHTDHHSDLAGLAWVHFRATLGLSGILEHYLKAPCIQDKGIVFLCPKFSTPNSNITEDMTTNSITENNGRHRHCHQHHCRNGHQSLSRKEASLTSITCTGSDLFREA